MNNKSIEAESGNPFNISGVQKTANESKQ